MDDDSYARNNNDHEITTTTAAGTRGQHLVHRDNNEEDIERPARETDTAAGPPIAAPLASRLAPVAMRSPARVLDAAAAAAVAAAPPQYHTTTHSSAAQHQSLLRQQAVSHLVASTVPSSFGSSGVVVSHQGAAVGGGGGGSSRVGGHNWSPRPDASYANVPERSTEDYADGLVASSGWSDVDCSQDPSIGGVPPSARSLHAAALLNGILYVFGGYDGRQRVNTFHAYSFAEKRWSPVLPSANSGPPPSPRDRHVAVTFGNSFYVHGGFDGTARVSEFFAFDFSTMTWREVVALQGRPPSPRHSHAAVVHGHSMYVFGGYDGAYKSDLHEFDFTLSRWQCIPATGRRPRARYRATCVVHKNYMILFGGHDGSRHMSDTHIFDFDTRTWMMVETEGPPPVPRDSHVSVLHGNSLYVFGGSSGSAMNDLHELQLPSNPAAPARWRPVQTLRVDQPRHRFCHVAVVYNDSMYCFGGYDGSDRLNDFIRFDFTVYDLSFEVPPSTLIADFRALINDSTLSDVTFVVENQSVYAHKLLLMRCSYFQALFLGPMKESSQDTIRLDHVRHPVFLSVLEYLYTDQLRVQLDIAMELFEAADLFCIPRLKTMCEKRMLQSINVENAAGIFHAADRHSAAALRQKCKKYILSHFEEVCKSGSFEEMGRSNIELVFELLQSR